MASIEERIGAEVGGWEGVEERLVARGRKSDERGEEGGE